MLKILVLSFLSLIPLALPIGASADEWSAAADMPTPRSEVTAAAIGSRIYVIGGFTADGDTSNAIEVYDPRSNTWSSGKALPISLHHAASATYDGRLYVVGGFREGWIPSNTLFIYDPLTNEWVRGTNMPTPRGALTAQFVDGKLYAIGGSNGIPLNTNEMYDPVLNEWSVRSSMPTAREHLASGTVDGKIYVIGGRQGGLDTNLDVNEEYDPILDEWRLKTPMPSKRGGIFAADYRDSIFVFGGETPVRTFYNNEQYIPRVDMWIERERMPTPRHGLSAAEAGGNIYVIGGGTRPGLSVSAINEVFAPVNWKILLNVDVSPTVNIMPPNPTAADQVTITVSFKTKTAGYTVQFEELERKGDKFVSRVSVIPPQSDAVVAQVITRHEHRYSLGSLSTGDYQFSVYVNEQIREITKFRVSGETVFIDVSETDVRNVHESDIVVFQRIIDNKLNEKQSFISILQIKNEDGVTMSLSWSKGELMPNESRDVSQTWLPDRTGIYTFEFFVWQSMEKPNVIDDMKEVRITVT